MAGASTRRPASGYVVALDAKGGKKLWEKNLGSPVRASPTAAGERVFVVTKEGQVLCLSGSDGTRTVDTSGVCPSARASLSTPAPPSTATSVVVPYPTGDVVALRVSTGQPIWSESLARTRTASSLNAMSDAARPAIAGGVVYAVGHAGRMVATSAEDRRAPLVAHRRQHPAALGGRRQRVRGRYERSAAGHHAQRRQDPVGDQAARWRRLVRAGAGRQPAVAHFQQGPARERRGHQRQGCHRRRTWESPIFIAPVVAGGRMYVLTDNAEADGLQLNWPQFRASACAPCPHSLGATMLPTIAVIARPAQCRQVDPVQPPDGQAHGARVRHAGPHARPARGRSRCSPATGHARRHGGPGRGGAGLDPGAHARPERGGDRQGRRGAVRARCARRRHAGRLRRLPGRCEPRAGP